ncbi:MAG: hypothetical protein WCY10_03220 [Candidatus Omnitrophota bacterium]
MQTSARPVNLFFFAAAMMLFIAGAGCVELKYSAQNRLGDPVAIKSSRPLSSVYFSFPNARPKDKQYAGDFTSTFIASLEEKGFTAAVSPDSADIVITASVIFYRKAQGTFLFVLIVPTYRFNEEYDGIAMKVAYKTDKGRWHKKYRVYYRGWLDGDMEIASNLLRKAILKDISPPGA